MNRTFACLTIATALCLVPVSASAQVQAGPGATPESQGMDAAALATLVDYGASVRMDSLLVLRHGQVVTEAYYAPFRAGMKHRVNSATKAVVGALTGIAIARGDLPPPETPLATLLPEVASASAADARWRDITLQHLLDMTSGIAWDEPLSDAVPRSMLGMERSRDWLAFILGQPIAQAPGAGFNYNSGNPHLLSVALTRRTGQPTEAYAAQHLFGPLGITDYRWRRDPQGVAIGGWGLYLHPRDMARLGQLYLQLGEWQGRQVVPRAWAARAFAPQVDMSLPGYRYADAWWALPALGATMMVGYNNQLVLVLPQQGLVAAVTGRARYRLDDLVKHLQRAVRSAAALPDNPPAQAALRERIAAAATPRVQPVPAGVQPELRRAAFTLEDNPLGVRELAFDLEASPPTYRLRLRSRDLTAPIGMEGLAAEGVDDGTPLFTRGLWTDARTLQVEQAWPEEAASVRYVLQFDGDRVEVTRTNDFGQRTVVRGRRVPGG